MYRAIGHSLSQDFARRLLKAVQILDKHERMALEIAEESGHIPRSFEHGDGWGAKHQAVDLWSDGQQRLSAKDRRSAQQDMLPCLVVTNGAF